MYNVTGSIFICKEKLGSNNPFFLMINKNILIKKLVLFFNVLCCCVK